MSGEPPPDGFTHVNERGEARMVDVSGKETSLRRARAVALVRMRPETLAAVTAGTLPKGDVLAAARIAGIMAAKKVPELIPLCHPIRLDGIEIRLVPVPPDSIRIETEVRARDVTGVEMEALTAATVAALALYDMCKAVDRGMVVENVRLLEKAGGRSGVWKAEGEP